MLGVTGVTLGWGVVGTARWAGFLVGQVKVPLPRVPTLVPIVAPWAMQGPHGLCIPQPITQRRIHGATVLSWAPMGSQGSQSGGSRDESSTPAVPRVLQF